MTACGFAPATIDTMPMHDVLGLLRYWRDHPPANELLAAAYGVKPARAVDANDPSGIGDLMRRYPDGKVGA